MKKWPTILIIVVICGIWAAVEQINHNQRLVTLPIVETVNVSGLPYLDIKDSSGDSEDKLITIDTWQGTTVITWTPGAPPVVITIEGF